MILERIAAILACQKCKSKLIIGKTILCSKCGREYRIKEDVPIMHVEKDSTQIEKEMLRAKLSFNFTSFSEAISGEKEKHLLLSSQYANTHEITSL